MLLEHNGVFYIDSSTRFSTSNIDDALRQAAVVSRGILLFVSGNHSIFAATHFRMYRYLPIPRPLAVNITMWNAGTIYVWRSKEVCHEQVWHRLNVLMD